MYIFNEIIIDSLTVLLKGYKQLRVYSNQSKVDTDSIGYLIGQTIRQYQLPLDHYVISEKANSSWECLTSQNIKDSFYKSSVQCDRVSGSVILDKYVGSSKTGLKTEISKNEHIRFNDYFHCDHIIPVKLVIEKLLSEEELSPVSICNILDEMYICIMLKSEDRILGRTKGRTLCYKDVINKIYNPSGIQIHDEHK